MNDFEIIGICINEFAFRECVLWSGEFKFRLVEFKLLIWDPNVNNIKYTKFLNGNQ